MCMKHFCLFLLCLAFTLFSSDVDASGRSSGNAGMKIDAAAPLFTNLNGDIVNWAGQGNMVTLDQGSDATLQASALDALNNGNGNYVGATLTVQRIGAALPSDVFGFNTNGALFGINGADLQSGGQTFATFTNTGGLLTINFTSAATIATTALVNHMLRSISYRNDSPAGKAIIRFSFSDGTANTTAEVKVSSNSIYVTNSTDTKTVDLTNGVSFSEAVAIAMAANGNNQTIVMANNYIGSAGIALVDDIAVSKNLEIITTTTGLSILGRTFTVEAGATLTLSVAAPYATTITSKFTGGGTFVKAGDGRLTIQNTDNSTATFTVTGSGKAIILGPFPTGNIVLNGGDLSCNSSYVVNKPVSIIANTTLSPTNLTFNGEISGSGSLAQSGGTLILGGNNTNTGGVSITANGILSAATASNLPSGTIALNGGTLAITGATNLTNDIEITANSTLQNANAVTLAGVISGNAKLAKTGAGTLTLTGNNTIAGGMDINSGLLAISSGNNLGTGTINFNTGNLNVTQPTTIENNITLSAFGMINNAAAVTISGAINGNYNFHKIGQAPLTLTGNNSFGSFSFIHIAIFAGPASLPTSTIALNSGSTLTINGGGPVNTNLHLVGNSIVNVLADVTWNGEIFSSGQLTKTGSAKLILAGANSYTGATVVSEGTFVVNGSLNGTAGISVANGATLGGSGSVFAANSNRTLTVSSGGILAPGNSTGQLTVNGNLTMANASNLVIEINGTTAGIGYDQVVVTGNVNISGAKLAVNHNHVANSAASYTIINKTGTGAVNGIFYGLAENDSFIAAGNGSLLKLSYMGGTGNDLVLTTQNVLPVVLINFTAKIENNTAKLRWQTASETNNKSFEIYRSGDDKQFVKIGDVGGNGTTLLISNYSFADRQPLNGNNYYKLVQIDNDGRVSELGLKSLVFSLSALNIQLCPNPVLSKATVLFDAGKYHTLTLIGIDGKVLQTIRLNSLQAEVDLNLANQTAGTYVLRLSGHKVSQAVKLVKL